MKKTVNAVVALILLLISENSCKKDSKMGPSPQYNMNFTLSAGTAPLLLGPGNVVTNTKLKYYLSQLQFYAGHPRLVKTDGTEVPLTNLFLVEFNSDPTQVPVTNALFNTEFNFSIPAGSYTGIKFGIGVPDDILDTIRHYHQGNNDPLNQIYGMMWPGFDTIFRNIAIDVFADTSTQQNQAVNREYTFHLLEDAPSTHSVNIYSEIFFPDAFTVGNGDSHTATFNLDFNNVFFNSSNPIDLRTSVSTDMNTSQNIPLGEAINKNFYSSLTLK